MTDARIRHEFFQVGLDKSDERAVNNADDREDGNRGCKTARGIREKRETEAKHAVGAHFEEYPGEHNGTSRGRFHVGVRQPGVEWEQRNFNRESDEEGQEEKRLRAARQNQCARLERLLNQRKVEGARGVVEPQNADKHKDGAGHGVQDEFDGGVDAAVMAPNADEQVHRNQHYFPEEEEEEEVERKEDADDSDFQQQDGDEEFFDALLDALPRTEYGDYREKGRQDDQKDADAVDSQMIVDVGLG